MPANKECVGIITVGADKEVTMAKGLFTNMEEIRFQWAFVQGNVEKRYDPNTRRNPAQARLCTKKQNKKIQKAFMGKTR